MDVIVKAQRLILPTRQQAESIGIAEVFKLHEGIGPTLSHREHKFIDELGVAGADHALMTQAEVAGIGQIFGIVRADINRHGQGFFGSNARARRIKGQLADRDAHAVNALIA